jgi:formyl-CoA transferase
VKLSASPAEVKRSPLLGEHNEEILKSVLGYEDSELQSIIDSGAIG